MQRSVPPGRGADGIEEAHHGFRVGFARAAFDRPEAATLLLDTILGGWVHGRESPPLLGVAWEAIWDQPLDTVRSGLGLKPYASPWPADLFEQLAAAA